MVFLGVSVIVVNWNGKHFLENCLTSLSNQTYRNHEIILVDNGSTDGSANFVKKHFPEVKVICNIENVGPAAARNIGFEFSSGEYIIFLDNDVEADSNAVGELVKAIQSDHTIGAAQSKLLWKDDPGKLCGTGQFVNPLGDYFIRGSGEKDKGQYDFAGEIFNAISACMIIRRKVFAEIGMFDPIYFIQHEDIDLGWRVWLRGYKVVFVPTSVAYHAVHGSGGQRIFFTKRNLLAMMIKNYSIGNLLRYVPQRIILEIASLFRLFFRRKVYEAIATAKAIVWNLTNFRYVWKEHLRVQNRVRRVSDDFLLDRIMQSKSLVHN